MDTGEVAPGGVPVRAEVVHHSERTRVTRLFRSGGTAIRKEPLGPGAEHRARHETAMLGRLRGVPGVAQLADGARYPGSLVLVDAGRETLAVLGKPLAADELAAVAAALARAVAGMHARGVLHRDITPANVVVSDDGVPCLVDFALGVPLAEIRPEFTPYAGIAGTLAYLAPESTGRTGRPVDQRADLYALGAVLYELATGAPPFGAGDPLRLTHDHLARVPVPPAEVNRAIPEALSAVIMHLLEKEPDRRYQTADGVVHDLERLGEAQSGPAPVTFRIGERDVPPRLVPPSRLAGRDSEVTMLEEAFAEALAGRCRGVLISGAPGVGKTALADQLRSAVTAKDGWFVAGKFDQYRRDLESDGVAQAFRALGRLLLAEPEEQLAQDRGRLLAALGANAGLTTAVTPEFAALLGVPPDPGDPLTAQVRAQLASVAMVRAVASRERPLVFFIDDLQWAGPTPLGFVDMVLSGEQVEGLLLVGTYREDDVDAAHVLTPLLSRWRDIAGARHLRLDSLPMPASVAMVTEMLHEDTSVAEGLVEVMEPYTRGNPYEIVELLNALRRDEVLTATATGWRWDEAAVRAHLGRSERARLLVPQIEALPARSREMVEAMACLGGRAGLTLLEAATGEPAGVVEQTMAPALAEGLLVAEPGARQAMRFRHDRIRDAIVRALDPGRRRGLQLAMARRLAGVPELFAVAAEQYLPVIDAIDDVAERRQVVRLLRHAADQARLIGDHTLMNALLSAALQLTGPDDTATLIEVRTGLHAALYSMGRLEEADVEYRAIERLSVTAMQRADAAYVQVRSLTHRKRFAEAIGLGVSALRELGIAVPAADRLPADLDRQFGYLYRWLDHTDAADDLARPEITDPALLAATRLIDTILPGAYFTADLATYGWLGLEALRIWLEHGPGRTLIGPASTAAFAAAALRGDYAAGYRAIRRILAVGGTRGYEPGTSQARHRLVLLACWLEPAENAAREAQRARERLLACGDLATTAFTYYPSAYYLLDCAPTLDDYAGGLDEGLAFVRRIGSEHIRQLLDSYRWLAGVLRGESSVAADKAVRADEYAGHPVALFFAHTNRAVAAAVFGDPDSLARHTAAAVPLLPAVPGLYPTAVFHFLRGLALAEQIRATRGDQRGDLLSELDDALRWLAARAADAPENFLHLLRLAEAERAWAAGDFRAAVLAFDAARREAARRRPWHQALITERAARFYLAHGVDQAGYDLLAQACQQYLAWGATAKVAQLDWAYPATRAHTDADAAHGIAQSGDVPHRRAEVTTGTIDLLGIVSVSQALSSETSIERLHARVAEVLGAMTGATDVHLVLWDGGRERWLRPASGGTVPADGPGRETTLPLSVLRYVQRTGEPLVAVDAAADDRFARDPYFAGTGYCSLLAVPVVSRGALRAVLVAENQLIRGAFTAERLDAVRLIAGQLAVSLDNAQLYAELAASRARIVEAGDQARHRIERDLHDGAQQQLVSLVLGLRAAQAAVPPDLGELAAELEGLASGLNNALQELRETARGIHPAVLASGGLGGALKMLARRCPVPVELDVRTNGRLPEQVEVSAYYVVAEALTNAARHARASAITVTADTADSVLRVTVRDDGAGGADFTGGTGLVGLKDRVEALGGRILVDSPRGAGTTLRVDLPLTETPPAVPDHLRPHRG
jgi:predicted ATPase/signal transduction histidine kinase